MRGGCILAAFVLLTAIAFGAKAPAGSGKFQPVPPDPSLQPPPPQTNGAIVFAGNHAYTEEQLRVPLAEAISEIQKNGLTRPRADDTAYYLSVFYRKHGYANADVHWDIRGSHLLLTITEGKLTTLRHVTFAGNHAADQATLFQYLIGGTEERLLKEPAAFPFVEGDIQTGVARVRGYYAAEGYLDSVVDDAVITFTADHSLVDILVKVQEGPKYTFGNITFDGTLVFPNRELLGGLSDSQEATTGISLAKPKKDSEVVDLSKTPYTTQQVNTMQHNLQFFLKKHGYYRAEVSGAGDPKKAVVGPNNIRRVPVHFTLTAGPLYHFDGASVTGLERLHPTVVTNRFRPLTGQVYAPEKLDERFRELLRTGLFNNLRINTTPIDGNQVHIELTAEEAKAKELGFSIGYGSYDGGMFGLKLGNRNIAGSGRPLTLDIDYTQRELRAELLFVDPWLFESDVRFQARLFAQQRDEIGYTHQDTGLRLEITRKVNPHVELSGYLQAKHVDIVDEAVVPELVGPTSYHLATIGISQNFDYRDSPVSPNDGYIISTGMDFDALAGEAAFARFTVRGTKYIPIATKYLLALGARGGLLFPFTDVPIDERYFSGGGSSVRSFRERKLGPRDRHGYPIGGEAFTVFNIEFDFPLKGALLGAVFVDAGNVVSKVENAGVSDMRYAVGVGLRYKLPIGPVRLDVGINPNPKVYEDWGAVNFSFGFAF